MAKRGGYRRNAGRPALGMTDKRVAFTCMVSPDTKRDIEYLKGNGFKMGRLIDQWVAEFTSRHIEMVMESFSDHQIAE